MLYGLDILQCIHVTRVFVHRNRWHVKSLVI